MSGASLDPRLVEQRSWFWRMRFTPLSELIRGEMSARLSVAYAIDQANLPAPLPTTIMTVVRRTRLWHRERLEVARELIAHFQDGLARGAAADQLARDFGDFKQAAKLIRRAKRRNRPLWWQASKRGVQGVLLLPVFLIVLYVSIAIRFFAGSPTISHDYLADLNREAAAAPADQRAWPLYRDVLLKLPGLNELMAEATSQLYLVSTAMKPGHPDWPLAERFVIAQAEQIAMIRKAASMPALGFVVGRTLSEQDKPLWPSTKSADSGSDGPLVQVLMPHLGEMRRLAQWLVLDTRRAAVAGNSQTVMDNIEAKLNIARHSRETPTLIADLVSMAILQMTFDRISEFLADQPDLFSDEQLQRLAHRIAGIRDEDIRVRLDGERLWFYDVVQRSYTDDGAGDGRLTAEAWKILELLNDNSKPQGWGEDALRAAAGPAYGVMAAGRRELVQEFERLMCETEANGNLPMWERGHSTVDEQLNRWMNSPMDRLRYLPIALLMPALDKATQQQHYVRFGRDVILTAIALELHRRRHGEWPASVNELVPSFLPAIARDIFDGEPMKYALIDGRPVLYSVGNDRNDDGGKPPIDESQHTSAKRWVAPVVMTNIRVDGDWILWPPVADAPKP